MPKHRNVKGFKELQCIIEKEKSKQEVFNLYHSYKLHNKYSDTVINSLF